jgi:hypothetical protein
VIRFADAVVTNGRKVWTVTGAAYRDGIVRLERIEGDINDIDGLREAMQRHCDRPRYFRNLRTNIKTEGM